jgi:hypothetical protein
MTTGSSPPWGAKVALLLSAGGLPLFNSRAAGPTAGAFIGHARPLDLRSARAWFPRDCRLAFHSLAVPPVCFALLVWKASGDPNAENDQIRSLEPLDESLSRGPPPHRKITQQRERPPIDPALEKDKEGRAVLRGRPLRGRHSKNTDLFSRPCDRPSHVTLPHRGLAGSGAGGSALVLALCPTWALTAGGCTGSRRSGA